MEEAICLLRRTELRELRQVREQNSRFQRLVASRLGSADPAGDRAKKALSIACDGNCRIGQQEYQIGCWGEPRLVKVVIDLQYIEGVLRFDAILGGIWADQPPSACAMVSSVRRYYCGEMGGNCTRKASPGAKWMSN